MVLFRVWFYLFCFDFVKLQSFLNFLHFIISVIFLSFIFVWFSVIIWLVGPHHVKLPGHRISSAQLLNYQNLFLVSNHVIICFFINSLSLFHKIHFVFLNLSIFSLAKNETRFTLFVHLNRWILAKNVRFIFRSF